MACCYGCYGCYGCCCPDASRKATRNNVRINSSFKFNGAYDALVASSSPAEMLLSNSAEAETEDGAGTGGWECWVATEQRSNPCCCSSFCCTMWHTFRRCCCCDTRFTLKCFSIAWKQIPFHGESDHRRFVTFRLVWFLFPFLCVSFLSFLQLFPYFKLLIRKVFASFSCCCCCCRCCLSSRKLLN